MKDFRGLNIWQWGRRITLSVYRDPHKFPREEVFGISAQLRRCSASIAANLAEGQVLSAKCHLQ
jgi:four helix bundle protein